MPETIKLKWRVSEAPTGRYRSFQQRRWPSADLPDGRPAISLDCKDEYTGPRSRAIDGLDIRIDIADWSALGHSFVWRSLKQRAMSLTHAKRLATEFLNAHPEFTKEKTS